MVRKHKGNHAWLPSVFAYLNSSPRDLFLSYDQIISGAKLSSCYRDLSLKDSTICPSRMRFAMIMKAKKEIDKQRENISYGRYLWRIKDEYRHKPLRYGRTD